MIIYHERVSNAWKKTYPFSMIYLIGGAPRVGKSTLAKKIADSTKSHVVSTDAVCSQMIDRLSADEKRILLPVPSFSGTASENTLTPKERVDLQCISARSVEPELDKIITQALDENKSIVIEGIHLFPNYVHQLLLKHGPTKFAALFIGQTATDLVVEGIVKNTSPNNWLRESNSDVIRQVADFVAVSSKHIQEEAVLHGLIYQERTPSFESDLERFSQHLLNDLHYSSL